MASLNIDSTRKALQAFDFQQLFVEELGWSHPAATMTRLETIKGITLKRKPIAQLAGAVVFEIMTQDGKIPEPKDRAAIAKEIQKLHYENVLIFVDPDRTQSIWHWLKNQDKKIVSREHFFIKGQPGDLFIAKLSSLVFDISEFDQNGNIPIAEVASRMKSALDVERVTKKFFRDYQTQFVAFLELIEGIDNEADKHWYASVILNRLMFIYFLQKKLFLDKGNEHYLNVKLQLTKDQFGENKFYSTFLNKLFFEGFALVETKRDTATNILLGEIKYLNGGLFLEHKIEKKYAGKIKICDEAFVNLFVLFDSYSWTLNDTPGGKDDEINPDVLGYIFEKYINQKAFGAYYTRLEITEYLCEQTVYKLILDAVNDPIIDPDILIKTGLDKFGPARHFPNIAELLLNLDAPTCKKLIVGEDAVLNNLSLLDPACGSGAFLVAAMKTLINVYAAILGKIEFLGDEKLIKWRKEIELNHPSINYYIKKQIITNNLYGVDIMEEATEIAKLRLFLALVASAQNVDQLEPLPNIDFNIMCGNSLIGMMRVDHTNFEEHQSKTLFRKSYGDLLHLKNVALNLYKNPGEAANSQMLKDSIEKYREEALPVLNDMLMEEFNKLGVKFEQITWDNKKNKEGKSIKRKVNLKDISALEPFHWGYEFSEIFREKNGFDAIITNPPWEVFKPNSKEFFLDYSNVVSRKKMSIKDFENEQGKILEDDEIREAWTDYLSRFPYVSAYYRTVKQYENQISIVNGKKAGTDINLYKLFTEQCFNLLKKGGYCGIVIPSGIYTDLGTKQLRQLLFEQNKVTGLFGFENRKEIFEGVHRSFKFVVLSFEKGYTTKSFPAAFMRHDIQELDNFPAYGSFTISTEFIKKMSPDSLSITEIKNEIDFNIAEKISIFPFLGDKIEGLWNLVLGNEFHMTNDSHLFLTKPSKGSLSLYEGKMIWQFNHKYYDPKYWIEESAGRKSIVGREPDTEQILGYQNYRLAFRDVTSPTNERSMINSVLPKNVFAGNTLVISKNNINNSDLLNIVSILNSFINDFIIRQKITSHCNLFYVYQLMVPRLIPKDKWYYPIIERAARLICTSVEFAELWEEVMKTQWSESIAATQEYERNRLRAELDGIIAHIYGLTEGEFTHILSTFPIVSQAQKVATQNAYRDVERGLIK